MSGPLNSLASLTNLQVLYVDNNNFNGSVDWLRNFTKLSLVSLKNNFFTGPLPLLQSSQMLSIDFGNCSFNGTVPSSYASMGILITLHLSGNKLHGPLPDIFENMTFLRSIQLQNNSFSSSLPESLTKCISLVYFDVSNNSISGTLPNFKNIKELEYFLVSHNKLTGTIPKSMLVNEANETEARLIGLDLSNNSFYGQMSDFLSIDLNLTNLEYLNLNGNLFSGPVVIPMVDNSTLQKLRTVVLSQNCFTSINSMDPLCSARNLTLLHMGVLYRTGKGKSSVCKSKKSYFELPYNFGNINTFSCLFESERSLTTLILTGLGLEGKIPLISNSSKINKLLLNFNQLTGIIILFHCNAHSYFIINSFVYIGTLPLEYQQFGKSINFSIEENKINGSLTLFNINQELGVSINMSVNRLVHTILYL